MPAKGWWMESEISQPHPRRPLEETGILIQRAKQGDATARAQWVRRSLPACGRWAHRRLPVDARSLAETDDLVQITLMRALDRLDHFESRGTGAFFAYLRSILLNALRDELRRR